jgi:ADP-ribose pyrophosphatase YjhB (NUDIX family)
MSKEIRIRVAGIYVANDHILLVKHSKFGKEYYLLPGGGQELGETAPEALVREWEEEMDLKIQVGEFLFAGESIPPGDSNRRQVQQMVFSVNKIEGTLKLNPDDVLVGCEWVPLTELPNIVLFPLCKPQIQDVLLKKQPKLFQTYVWTD